MPRSQVPVQLSVLVVWQSGLHVTRKLGRGLETRLRVATLHTVSLVPRPLPDFISQPWRKIVAWEWPGDEANILYVRDKPSTGTG